MSPNRIHVLLDHDSALGRTLVRDAMNTHGEIDGARGAMNFNAARAPVSLG